MRMGKRSLRDQMGFNFPLRAPGKRKWSSGKKTNTPTKYISRNEIRQQEDSGHREQHRGGVQQAHGGAGGQEEAGHGVPRQEV